MGKTTARKQSHSTKGVAEMDEAKKAQDTVVETLTVWAETNQKVLRDLTELTAATAKEGVRLYAELQQGGIEALREAQGVALRWQSAWQDGAKDPVAWYQKAMAESVDQAQKAFKLVEGNTQAVTRSAERLGTQAEQAGRGIQETLTAAVTKMKGVYSV